MGALGASRQSGRATPLGKFVPMLFLAVLLFLFPASNAQQACSSKAVVLASSGSILPSAIQATFYQTTDVITQSLQLSYPSTPPIQAQVLFDTSNLSLVDATSLATSITSSSFNGLFGPNFTSGSQVGISFYAQSSPNVAPAPINVFSGFSSDFSNVSASFQAAILASGRTPSVPTYLLQTAQSLIQDPRLSWDINSVRVLIIVTPQAIPASSSAWNTFFNVTASNWIIPIFVNPTSLAGWSDAIDAAWQSSFSGFPSPVWQGSQPTSTPWNNFNLYSAINQALNIATSNASVPLSSSPLATPKISGVTSVSRTVSVSVAWNTSLSYQQNTNISAQVGFLGWTPTSFTSSLALSPSSQNIQIPLQALVSTIAIPAYGTSSIVLNSLPSQGTLTTTTGGQVQLGSSASTSLVYSASPTHTSSDSFSFSLETLCGNVVGPYTATLNMSLVPLPASVAVGSISIGEDDLSNHTINLFSLVTNPSASATGTFQSLPWKVGALALANGPAVQIGTSYPLSQLSSLVISLYAASRGPFVDHFHWILTNDQLGSQYNGTFTVNITDVSHAPTITTIPTTNSMSGQVALFIHDVDGNAVTATVSCPSCTSITWFDNNKSYSICPGTSSYSIALVNNNLLGSTTFTISVSDGVHSPATASGSIIGNGLDVLLGSVLNLLSAVLSVLSSSLVFDIQVPSGTTNCYVPAASNNGGVQIYGGSAITPGTPFSWTTNPLSLQYKPYPGSSGPDFITAQCLVGSGSSATTQVAAIDFTVPTQAPVGASLSLVAPLLSSILIPVQALTYDSSGIVISALNGVNAAVSLVDDTFLSITPDLGALAGSVTFQACAGSNNSLCSDVLNYVFEALSPLPLIGNTLQSFFANLDGSVNTFNLLTNTGVSIEVLAITPISAGLATINGAALQAGNVYSGTSFNFSYSQTVTSDLPLYSFTYVALDASGRLSSPGIVAVFPNQAFVSAPVLPLLELDLAGVSGLLQGLLGGIETTAAPLFQTPVDIFGFLQLSSLQLLDATFSALLQPLASGHLQFCTFGGVCTDITTPTLINLPGLAYVTAPIEGILSNLTWTVTVTMNGTSSIVNGTTSFVNNDILGNIGTTLPVLQSTFPASPVLIRGSLTPTCNPPALPPYACVNGNVVALTNVTISSDVTVSQPQSTVDGDFTVNTGTTVTFVPYYSNGATYLPFINVTGDVIIDGAIHINISYTDIQQLAIGNKRSSNTIPILQASNSMNSSSAHLLPVATNTDPNPCNSYDTSLYQDGSTHPTLVLLVSFSQNPNCNPDGTPTTPEQRLALEQQRETIQIIWITCAAVGGFLVLVAVAAVILFRCNVHAKRVARPFSIRKARGATYRTQKSAFSSNLNSEMNTPRTGDSSPSTPHEDDAFLPESSDSQASTSAEAMSIPSHSPHLEP